MKTSRKWIGGFFLLMLIGMIGFMMINYTVDTTGYFAVERGATEVNPNGYSRAAKCKYIRKYPDTYNAFVMGDSKSGVFSTELLSEYTGKNYYNFYLPYGCASDYLTYTKYLIETADVEETTLALSGMEVQKYSQADLNEVYEVPAFVEGNIVDVALENLNYLCRSISTVFEYLSEGKDQLDRGMDNLITGERNYSYIHSQMEEDPDTYMVENVLLRYAKNISRLVNGQTPGMHAIDGSLDMVRQIKAMCEENDITLKVVMGPTFISELYKLENKKYYDYLRELVKITEFWDFGGYCDYMKNPYNFVNESHYDKGLGDLMINTMYGKDSREGFGILLTEDNIEEYITQRKKDYKEVQEEYESTGTIAYFGMDDPSYIPYK